ncbi:glycosyltransferase [Mangrovibacterium marinum]|uniref:Glycosyl transferase family 4 n=1 Tax=Mangrovibacterium marinum TaxID=1639118 RepID=A0A2T5C3N8_9BACT|nr:glycosyltransferase [Mangrovibacterium marinum]PTN09377.1 glycosyl transferase family 4 [Mangrovibacterium marinum]
MTKKLHIVSFNTPYPADYGGVIDIYYKLKALHCQNVQIHLHCFEYDRPQAGELTQFCEQVFYYPRQTGIPTHFSPVPYIVKGRQHPQLLKNLLAMPAPVLFEGLHCCSLLDHPLLRAFPKLVRAHNIEHKYYYNLYHSSTDWQQRLYYLLESFKLKRFEKLLRWADHILAISASEADYFAKHYGKTSFIPAFHSFNTISCQSGTGDYLLFHGNLSVSENQQAVSYLIDQVFSQLTERFVIAGKNPPAWLQKKVRDIPHITIIANPAAEEMNQLITDAHICLLPTFQASGMKLKLLHSLFGGRHCLVNSTMVEGSGLENLCHIADSPEQMIIQIRQLMDKPFDEEEIIRRKMKLETFYANEINAQKIMELL